MSRTAADIAEFFDEDMPGYALASVGGVDVPGLFRNRYAEAFNMAAGSVPTFRCASADVSTVAEGTAVTIDSTAYTVAEVQSDGTGITLFILEKA
jgi:hypothetical protein